MCDNYNPGDEIFIVGFSRGAFTARSVSGLICNLGLLNRVGLSQFGAIFHDYQTFPNWKYPGSFDKDDHLVGFTLTNFMRRKKQKASEDDKVEERESAALEEELNKDKRMFFETMTTYRENRKGYGPMDLRKMAEKYRDRLEEVRRKLSLWSEKQFIDDYLHSTAWFSPSGRRNSEMASWASSRSPQTSMLEQLVSLRILNPTNEDKPSLIALDLAVWDTVGSLGWPKMPWEKVRIGRSAEEVS